jgi:hypothetical protein
MEYSKKDNTIYENLALHLKFEELEFRLVELTNANERLARRAAELEAGIKEIIQRERYPRESGSHVYDGIYPTGRFAVKVLKGEWKDADGIESNKK